MNLEKGRDEFLKVRQKVVQDQKELVKWIQEGVGSTKKRVLLELAM